MDLGGEQPIDRITVWNRYEFGLHNRMHHVRVRVLDAARRVVYEQVIDRAPAPSAEVVRPGLLAAAKAALAAGQPTLDLRLPVTPPGDAPSYVRVSVAEALSDLRRDDPAESSQEWVALEPDAARTEKGTTLTPEGRGLVRTESRPEAVSWVPPADEVRAVRIESRSEEAPLGADAPYFNEYQAIATAAVDPRTGALRGRFVRLDLPGDNRRFPRASGDGALKSVNLQEFQVFQGDRNVAEGKPARQSSDYDGSTSASLAVDGRTGWPHTHTGTEPDPWWEVDLGGDQAIDRMVVWTRTDDGLHERLNHFRIRVLDRDRKVVYERVIAKAPNPSAEIVPRTWLEPPAPASAGKALSVGLPGAPGTQPPRYRVSVAGRQAELTLDEDLRREIANVTNDLTYRLAIGCALNGDHEKASAAFGTALGDAKGFEARRSILASAAGFDEVIAALIERHPEDAELQLAHARESAKRGRKLLDQDRPVEAEAELAKAHEVFTRLRQASAEPGWTVLTATEAASEGNSTLAIQADGSVLAGGPTPPRNVYTISFRDLPSMLEGLRLDVLTHESLPRSGPGRGLHNGNFLLTTVKARLESPTNPGVFRNLKLSRASADFVQGFGSAVGGMADAAGLIDVKDDTAWAIHPEEGKPHHAVLELEEPVATTKGTVLRLTLEFKSEYDDHQIGRFRFSVPSDGRAFRVLQVRNDLRDDEVAELCMARAKAWSRQGRPAEAAASLGAATALTADRKFESKVIAEAAAEDGLLEALAEHATGDAPFQAELARHYASQGDSPRAATARARVRPLLESELEQHPYDSGLASELAELLLLDTSDWTVLKPSEMRSDAGLTLTAQDDQSVFVGGTHRPVDVYTVDFRDAPREVRAIRLEALKDARLPGSGPGTWPSGQFVLSEIRTFSLNAPGGSGAVPIALRSACATFEERPAAESLEPGASGWSIGGGEGRSQTAYFDRGDAADALPSDRLRLQLAFAHAPDGDKPATLGRFRLSVTTDPRAFENARRRVAPMKIADPWTRLAAAYAESGDETRAARFFGKALELAAGEEPRKPILEVAGRYRKVLAALIERQPDDAQSQLVLARELTGQGKARLADGNPPEAIVALEQAREIVARRRANYAEPKWTVLTPTSMTSVGGATLTAQPDGSILASGTNPERGAYSILAEPALRRITALRLEALPDPSLPAGGPGRHESGNFNLNELRVFSGSKPCPLTDIAVEYDQLRQHRLVIDRRLDSNAGWSNYPRAGRPNAAVIATEFEHVPRDGLKIEMYFARGEYPRHDLGRFRLSVTDDPDAFRKVAARYELKDSEVYGLLLALAKAYVGNGQPDRASAAFAEAVAVAPDAAAKAQVVLEASPVVGLLEKLAEGSSTDASFQAELARHYAAAGDAPRAEAARARARASFEELLAKEPDDSVAAAALAGLILEPLEGENGPEPAAREQGLHAALKLVDPWAKLAAAYHLSDDPEPLARLLDRRPAAVVGVGDVYAAAGAWERAIVEYDRALKNQPSNEALFAKLVAAYQSAGRSRDLIPMLAERSAADPKDTERSLKVAALQAWFGREAELADTRRRILAFAKDSNELTTVERAAKACSILPTSDRADVDAALACGRKAMRISSDQNGALRGWCQMALGMAEYRGGNDAAADEALLAAAKADPNNQAVTGISAFYRALALFRQGKADEARSVAIAAATQMKPLPADERSALDGNDNDLILWLAYQEAYKLLDLEHDPYSAGQAFAARRDWGKAILAYSEAIAKQAADAGLFAKRAAAYAATGAWDAARADWSNAVRLQPDLAQQAFESLRGGERWNEAGEFALLYVEQKPDDSMRWVMAGPVLALAEDQALYREFCGRVERHFDNSGGPEAADRVVKSALLRPDAIDYRKLPGDLLGASLDRGEFPDGVRSWGWSTRALWAYRNGDAESAVRFVAKSEEHRPGDVTRAMNAAVLAMAQQRLGHAPEARAALEEAAGLFAAFENVPGNKPDHDWLIARILFREAEHLIDGEKKP